LGEKVKPLVLGRGLPCKTAGNLQTDDRLRATRIEFLEGCNNPQSISQKPSISWEYIGVTGDFISCCRGRLAVESQAGVPALLR